MARVALYGSGAYICLAALSVVAAHILSIAMPQSGYAERVIRPIVQALSFVDEHWRAVLLLAAPVASPIVSGLIQRVRKVGPIELESIGPREKPPIRIGEGT